MITSLDEITVNTPEEFLQAVKDGYYFPKITISFTKDELYNYFCENKNISHYHMCIHSFTLLNGYGTAVNYKESLIWAKKASDYGNALATRFVGRFYEKGMGIEKDLNIAFEYYKRAASMGNAGAYSSLARFYRDGIVVTKNIEKALECFKKAEELGNLSVIYTQANIYFDMEEYEKAISLYEKSADLGISDSYFRLAYMLSHEKYDKLDYEKAAYYYQKLIDLKSDYGAMINLGVLYEEGKGVQMDKKKAFELYKMATENGKNAIAFSNLASCYFHGTGTEKDYSKALEACLASHENGGYGTAYSLLYKIYSEGLGTPCDKEKAKYYRDLALSSDRINVVVETIVDYTNEINELIKNNKLFDKDEAIKKLNSVIEKISKDEGFLQSYALAEIYFILTKLEQDKYKEHNVLAISHAKKVYEDGKELANHNMFKRLYGVDFFDFNTEYDYVCYDEAKFDGYMIAGKRINYVPSLDAKANNNSSEYWLPRARLIYAMYQEYNGKSGKSNYCYSYALSVNSLDSHDDLKDVLYPNALYMYAIRNLVGMNMEINEPYALFLLKLAGERYHSRGAFLYAKSCELKGDYEEAIRFYRIAISDKYPKCVKRQESLPSVLLKPGERVTYNIYYEYGGEKKVSYQAVEEIVENYDKYNRYIQHDEAKTIAELFLNAPNKAKNPDRFYKAFQSAPFYAYFDKFVEIYKNELQVFNTSTTEKAVNESTNSTTDSSVNPAIDNNASLVLDNAVIEENLQSHHIWGYLKFNNFTPAIAELTSALYFPNKYSEKEICKVISKYFVPLTPMKIQMSEVNEIIEYAKATGEYFKSGVLLLSFNCMEGLNLLTKHYMHSIDNLLKLSEVAIRLYEKQSVVYSFPYSFNKAMCLLSKGKGKGNKILKDIVSLKGASKLEKAISKPYQPAVDFLDGKEVNEEYLLNIRSKNG